MTALKSKLVKINPNKYHNNGIISKLYHSFCVLFNYIHKVFQNKFVLLFADILLVIFCQKWKLFGQL